MHSRQRQRGFILIVAVALIPLFGLAMLITAGQTSRLSQQTRMQRRQSDEKTLRFSAEAWLRIHPEAVGAMRTGQAMDVPVADVASRPAVCTAELIERRDTHAVILLTITVQELGKTKTALHRLSLAAAD